MGVMYICSFTGYLFFILHTPAGVRLWALFHLILGFFYTTASFLFCHPGQKGLGFTGYGLMGLGNWCRVYTYVQKGILKWDEEKAIYLMVRLNWGLDASARVIRFWQLQPTVWRGGVLIYRFDLQRWFLVNGGFRELLLTPFWSTLWALTEDTLI